MRYLLDTHVLIWALFDRKKISKKAASIIVNPDNDIFVSLVSFWEIALKYSIGKLSLHNIKPDELPGYVRESGFEILYQNEVEVSSFYRLPVLGHKDPFDRMIIWQSIHNDLHLISKDSSLSLYKDYGLKIIW
jgi:PIN domain nuclease of toxin-antitoxin system